MTDLRSIDESDHRPGFKCPPGLRVPAQKGSSWRFDFTAQQLIELALEV
jgi:hypothetical protein